MAVAAMHKAATPIEIRVRVRMFKLLSGLLIWSRPTLLRLLPARVVVVELHLRSDLGGLLAEVLLVHHAVVVAEEGHHPRGAPARGISDQRIAADQVALDHVVVGPARRVLALR